MPHALLAGVQLDDELFVHNRLHLFARGDARNFAAKPIAIGCEPVGHGSNLGQVEIAQNQLTRLWLVFDRNFVARFHIARSDIDPASIHHHMTMRHQLARCTARIGKPKAVNDVIESGLQQLEKRFTGDTTLS